MLAFVAKRGGLSKHH